MPLDRNTERNKVIFCTYSSIYSSIVLGQLLEDTDIEVVGIINSTRLHHPQFGQLRGAIKQIKLSGWRYSTYLFLVTDVFSWLQPFFSLKTIKRMAKINQIPILNLRDINRENGIEFIKNSSANVLLAAHFNQLIKPEILELSELQCINIHPSKLPAYKGVDPVFFAFLNDEKNVGVSLHKMTEEFDTGTVLLAKEFLVSNDESLFILNKKLFKSGAKLAIQWIKNKQDNNKIPECNTNKNSYDSWPSPEQIKQFKVKGKSLIVINELFNV